jgi:hypothetical protein
MEFNGSNVQGSEVHNFKVDGFFISLFPDILASKLAIVCKLNNQVTHAPEPQ